MTQPVLTFGEFALRLVRAPVCGGITGLNRDRCSEGAGLRTFRLVALATAGGTIGKPLPGSQPDTTSRPVQDVLAGIGFLGAGVIAHSPDRARPTVLATAATMWFIAGLAILCGIGKLPLVGLLPALAVALLVARRRIELLAQRTFDRSRDEQDDGAGGAPGRCATCRRTLRRRRARAENRCSVRR